MTTKRKLKPHLACDLDESKLKPGPMIAMVKIDGVRGINLEGDITGRSLEKFANPFISNCFSHSKFLGVDGELALGDITAQDLCRKTTGFVNRQTEKPGKPTVSIDIRWWAFDYLTPETESLPYIERLEALEDAWKAWTDNGHIDLHVSIVPWKVVGNLEELLEFEEWVLDQGYEGVIVRSLGGLHKSGRATVTTGAYLRIKRFVDFEGEVVNVIEAKENQNEAKTNALGRSERSTHQENMVPKGMVGMVQMRLLKDVSDRGKVILNKGEIVDVGPGKMTHAERIAVWEAFINKTPDNIVGKIGKAKLFPKGTKDKPRFPTWISLRLKEDMS